MPDRLFQALLGGKAGAAQRNVLPHGLAQRERIGGHVADVVGDLVGLTQAIAKRPPRARLGTCRQSACSGGRREQGAGLGALVVAQRHPRFALPGLASDDAVRHAHTTADGGQQRGQALRRAAGRLRQRLEGQHDQRVARQHRDALAERVVNRGQAAAHRGVVETRQIVVDQRGAVQQLDGARRGVAERRIVVAAGLGHRHAQQRTDARAAGEDRMPQGRGQLRRRPPGLCSRDRCDQRLLDAGQ